MIDKYDIIQIENLYYVSGMVMTNETYDIFSLKEIGVKLAIKVENLPQHRYLLTSLTYF